MNYPISFSEMAVHPNFSEEEVLQQLEALGFHNIPKEQLVQFKEDLEKLMQSERIQQACRVSPVEVCNNKAEEKITKYQSNVEAGAWKSMKAMRYPETFLPTQQQTNVNQGRLGATPSDVNATSFVTSLGDSELFGGTPSETLSSTSTSRRARTRKVARYRNGESVICDESMSVSDMGDSDISVLRESINKLNINEDRQTARPSRCRTRVVTKWLPRSRSLNDLTDLDLYLPRSFIRTGRVSSSRPKRHDPVTLYQQYKKVWDQHKRPGEHNHSQLRWNVRALLLHNAEPVQVPQKSRSSRISMF